jgi:hypothetical protein
MLTVQGGPADGEVKTPSRKVCQPPLPTSLACAKGDSNRLCGTPEQETGLRSAPLSSSPQLGCHSGAQPMANPCGCGRLGPNLVYLTDAGFSFTGASGQEQ